MFGDHSTFFDNSATALDPWLLTYLNPMPVGSMIRRDALVATGGWQLREGYEDWDLWMAFAERGLRAVYAGGLVFRYRVAGGGRWKQDMQARHGRLHVLLRERHATLYDQRRMHRRTSSAPLRERLSFPLIEALPLSASTKQRLYHAVHLPGHVVRYRLGGARRARPAAEAAQV
jgi:hypothetical protein